MTARIKKAGGGNPPATTTRQPLPYRRLRLASRADLTRAADVLLLLAFCSVSETTQVGLFALLDRHLRRAYEGVTR
jgi:hypothetical protein